MSCRQHVELVTDYLDDALSPSEKERFDAHRAQCPGCAEYLEQMRATVGLAGRLAADTIEPQTRERLLEVFRRWKEQADSAG
jgi:anti-sigma factor RsiW